MTDVISSHYLLEFLDRTAVLTPARVKIRRATWGVRSAQASTGGAGPGEFTAMCVLALATVLGNGAVLLALRRVPRAPAHAPLISLAVADLLLGLTVLPLAAAREYFIFRIDQLWCSLWSTSDVLCCTASILSLCALGWERWSGVTEPLKKAKRARLAKLHSWLLWPVAAMVAVPSALVPTRASDKPCVVNTNIGYVFYSITISFYVPASAMVILYVRVLTSLASPLIVRAHRGSRSPATPRAVSTTTIQITTAESKTTPIKSRVTASTAGVFTVTTNSTPTEISITTVESKSKAFLKGTRGIESPSKSVSSFKISGDFQDDVRTQIKQNSMISDSTPKTHDEKTILKKLRLFLSPNKHHLGVPTETFIRMTPKRRGAAPLKRGPGSPAHLISRQRRATRIIILLMSLFLICWTPFFVMLPIDAFCDCVSDAAWRWCTWLGYANSALDPLVYATASPSVRKALQSTISLSRSDPTTSGSSPIRIPRDRHSKIPKNISNSPNKNLSLIKIVEAANVNIIKITQNEV